jgi:hypothetical protein
MTKCSLAAIAAVVFSLSGPASGKLPPGESWCVATADLPFSLSGLNDTIRITYQQTELGPFRLMDPEIRVMRSDGSRLGAAIPYDLSGNASVIYKISDIYAQAGLSPRRDGLFPNVVQIVGSRNTQATYRNVLGIITPLIFTCDAVTGS